MSQMVSMRASLDSTTDTLRLESVTRENAGKYTCKLSNRLGKAESQTDLQVLGTDLKNCFYLRCMMT